ncbi:MAG: hypothetical protein WC775_05440 [Patescibacteria group bacterium]|jgi:hypothetical protein
MIDESGDIVVDGSTNADSSPSKSAEIKGHTVPFYIDGKTQISFSQFIKENQAEYDFTNGQLLHIASANFPQGTGQSDTDYDLQLLGELEKRFRFVGDYEKKTGTDADPLFAALKAEPSLTAEKWPIVLMAIEVATARKKERSGKQVTQEELKEEKRDHIRATVSRNGGVRLLSDQLEPIHEKIQPADKDKLEFHRTEKAKKAIEALTLIADDLLDVEDGSFPGRARTYRSRLKDIQGKLAKLQEDKTETGKLEVKQLQQQMRDIRRRFYTMVQKAIAYLDKPSEMPSSANTHDAAVFNAMCTRLRVLRELAKDKPLVDYFVGQGSSFTKPAYKGVGYIGGSHTKEAKLRSPHRRGMRDDLKNLSFEDLLDAALQGGDLMERRISEVTRAEHFVHTKKLVGDKAGKDTLKDLADQKEKSNDEVDQPPGSDQDNTHNDGGGPEPEPEPNPIQVPVQELRKSFNMALVSVHDHLEQNLIALRDAAFAEDSKHIPPPKTLLGKLIQPLRHPVKYIWQNSLFRPIFEQQALRFSADVMQIMKNVSGLDRSIPLHVSQEVIKKALSEGALLRKKKSALQRFGLWAGDKFAGITGIGQNSSQHLAKEWLKQNGAEYVKQFKDRGIAEQSAMGLEYSIVEQREGQSFADAVTQTNKHLISESLGETRYALEGLLGNSEDAKAVYNTFSRNVRHYIEEYAKKTISPEQLIASVNLTFRKDVLPFIPESERKLINTSEFGSNILPIAQSIQDNWTAYSAEVNGVREFDGLNLNFIVGKREWGGVRGKKEAGTLTHLLAQRIAEKQIGVSDGSRLAAVGIFKWITDAVKDVAVYGGTYIAGGLALTPRAAWGSLKTGLNLSPIGGAIATALTAGLKEGGLVVSRDGKLHGISGRYLSEFQQVAREYAGGHDKGQHTPIRNEMIKQALVGSTEASKLTDSIAALAHKDTLTEAETKQLVVHVAHAKARLRLTDESSKRSGTKLAIAQNFIRFHEDVETQEMAALRGSIAEGVMKLHRNSENQSDLDGKLFEAQAVFEGKLRTGNEIEKTAQVVSRLTGKSFAESKQLVNSYLNEATAAGIAVEGKSLNEAMSALAKLNARRGWTTVGKVAVIAPIAGIVAKLGYEEVVHATHNVQATGDVLAGLGQYAESWKKTLLDGEIPLRTDTVAGISQVVTDATPLQQGILQARAFVEPPIGEFWHRQTIDNAIINFNAGVRYGEFNGHHYISDMRSGEVVDLGNNHFDVQGGKLVLVDQANNTIDASNYFQGKFNVDKGPPLQEMHEVKTLVTKPGETTTVDVVQHGGGERAFVEHATKTDHREWYSYDKPGSQGNELTAYTYKNGDAVTVDYSNMGEAWQHGLNPEHIDVQDMMKNPQNYDGQLGMYVTIPGHPDEGMFIPDFNHDGKIIFDPHDTTHMITFDNGQSMSMADAAKLLVNQEALQKLKDGNIATELYGHRDVWNFGVNGEAGYGMVGRLVTHDGKPVFQSFATLGGTASVQGVEIAQEQIVTPPVTTEEISYETVTHETFNVVGKPFELNVDFVPIPLYWRKNVERSEKKTELPENYTPLESVEAYHYAPQPTAAVADGGSPAPSEDAHQTHTEDEVKDFQKQLRDKRLTEISTRLGEIESKPEFAAEEAELREEQRAIQEGLRKPEPDVELPDDETTQLREKFEDYKARQLTVLDDSRQKLSDSVFTQVWGHPKSETNEVILNSEAIKERFVAEELLYRIQDEEAQILEQGELGKIGEKLNKLKALPEELVQEVVTLQQTKSSAEIDSAVAQLAERTLAEPEIIDRMQAEGVVLTKEEFTKYLQQMAAVIAKMQSRTAAVPESEKAALKARLK